jgi:hypothetical protein
METLVIKSDQEIKYDNSDSSLIESSVEIDNQLIKLLNCFNCKQLSDEPKIFSCCNRLSCKTCYSLSIKKGFCLICACDKPKLKDLDFLVQALFDSVRTNCSFYCGGTFSLKEIKKHEKVCLFNPDALFICKTCEISFTKKNLENHDCIKELLISNKKLKSELENRSCDENEIIQKIKFTLK